MDGAYTLTRDESAALTRRVTTLSVATALVLTALKALVWLASGSVSILASLADSGLDLVAALGDLLRGALRRRAAGRRAPLRPRQGRGLRQPGAGRPGVRLGRADRPGGDPRTCCTRRRSPRAAGRMAVMAVSTVLTARPDRRPDPGAARDPLGGGDRRPRPLHRRPRLQRRRPGRHRRRRRCSASAASTPLGGLAVAARAAVGRDRRVPPGLQRADGPRAARRRRAPGSSR